MIRLFAAIALPPEQALALQSRQAGLAGARWRPLETLHVTLRFFGEISETQAEDLDLELSGVRSAPFEAALQGVGAFGEGRQIDSLWAGVAASEPLMRLASRCEAAARRAGLKPQTRKYHPHVTLAYLNRPDPAAAAAWIQAHSLLKSPAFKVEQFGLYSSWLGQGGSRYGLERVYPLKA